nr:hypothetical protein [Nonomuraea diastatica]
MALHRPSACAACGVLNAGFLPSGVTMAPPRCQIIGQNRHTVSSVPVTGYAVPYTPSLVSFLAAARKSSQVQSLSGYSSPAASKSFLL